MRTIKQYLNEKKELMNYVNSQLNNISVEPMISTISLNNHVNPDYYSTITIGNNNYNIDSSVVFNSLPNTPFGLTYGSVWRDENGFLRIV